MPKHDFNFKERKIHSILLSCKEGRIDQVIEKVSANGMYFDFVDSSSGEVCEGCLIEVLRNILLKQTLEEEYLPFYFTSSFLSQEEIIKVLESVVKEDFFFDSYSSFSRPPLLSLTCIQALLRAYQLCYFKDMYFSSLSKDETALLNADLLRLGLEDTKKDFFISVYRLLKEKERRLPLGNLDDFFDYYKDAFTEVLKNYFLDLMSRSYSSDVSFDTFQKEFLISFLGHVETEILLSHAHKETNIGFFILLYDELESRGLEPKEMRGLKSKNDQLIEASFGDLTSSPVVQKGKFKNKLSVIAGAGSAASASAALAVSSTSQKRKAKKNKAKKDKAAVVAGGASAAAPVESVELSLEEKNRLLVERVKFLEEQMRILQDQKSVEEERLREAIEGRDSELLDLLDKNRTLEEKLKKSSIENESLREKAASLERQVDSMEEAESAYRASLLRVEKELSELKRNLVEKEGQLQCTSIELREAVAKLDEMTECSKTFDAAIVVSTKKIEDLTQDHEKTKIEFFELSKAHRALKGQNESLKKEHVKKIAELSDQLAEKQSQLKVLESKIAELTDEITAQALKKLQADILTRSQSEKINLLEMDLYQRNAELAQLKEAFEARGFELDSVQLKLSEAEKDHQRFIREKVEQIPLLAKATEEIERLNKALNDSYQSASAVASAGFFARTSQEAASTFPFAHLPPLPPLSALPSRSQIILESGIPDQDENIFPTYCFVFVNAESDHYFLQLADWRGYFYLDGGIPSIWYEGLESKEHSFSEVSFPYPEVPPVETLLRLEHDRRTGHLTLFSLDGTAQYPVFSHGALCLRRSHQELFTGPTIPALPVFEGPSL